jgi:hypothetical protein
VDVSQALRSDWSRSVASSISTIVPHGGLEGRGSIEPVPVIFDAMHQARQGIFFEAYIFQESEIGNLDSNEDLRRRNKQLARRHLQHPQVLGLRSPDITAADHLRPARARFRFHALGIGRPGEGWFRNACATPRSPRDGDLHTCRDGEEATGARLWTLCLSGKGRWRTYETQQQPDLAFVPSLCPFCALGKEPSALSC